MKIKILLSATLALIVLTAQVVSVSAAPALQDNTPLSGTVQEVTVETDASGVTTVQVTVLDETTGTTQTVRLSVDDATSLGLVMDDGNGNFVPTDTAVGSSVTIEPTMVIVDQTTEQEHPVGSALSNFFSDLLGVNYDTIMEYHSDGIGFGVIAQALWMTNRLGGDTETFSAILEAKQSGDYSAVTLPDGSKPTNWGQFKKAVMKNGDKAKENLGAIMSGRAESNSDTTTVAPNNGNGPDKNMDKSNNGKGQDKDKSNNGKGKDKDKSNNGNNK